MRASVWNGEGVCSKSSEVAQGLRQGYVPFSLLFHVLFAAILLAVLERFGENADTIADLADLHEQPPKVGLGTALKCARRVI